MKKCMMISLLLLLALLIAACSANPSATKAESTQGTTATDAKAETPTTGSAPDTEPMRYSLRTTSSTDDYGVAGSYTQINDRFETGKTVQLEASVNAGYNFVGWFIGQRCVSTERQYTFTTGQTDTILEARFNYYTVETKSYTDDYEKAGTYTQLKHNKVSPGEQVTVEASVNPGYNFEGWFINDICVSSETSYSFTMKEQNVSLEARWNYYTVSTGSWSDDSGVAGEYTKLNSQKVSVGETVTVSASVNKGYNFEGWYVDGTLICADREYSFVMKERNVNLEALYSCYTVSTWCWSDDSGVAGEYTKLNSQKVSVGETVTVSASVNKGYNFEGWYVDGTLICADREYSFVMKERNVNLEALYSCYTVSTWCWSDDSGVAGEYTKLNSQKVSVGETVTVSASVNKGYNFEGWYVDGTLICADREYSFVMKERNVNLEALYSCYTLTVECWDNDEGMAGTYPQKQDERISAGEIVRLTATVKDGYNFEGWYIGGICVCKDLTYEFVMEKANKTVRVEYSWYRLDVVGLNGYWDTDPYLDSEGAYTKYEQQKVSAGETVTLIATPPEGYTFVGWYIGDVCVSTELEFTYTMTKEDVCIRAIFTYYILNVEGYLVTEFWAWNCYSWMELEDNMGSYTHYSEQKVRVGDTVTLTAVAKEGYRFVGWKRGNGEVLVSTDATYTFVMGAEDCYLEAIFVRDDFEEI